MGLRISRRKTRPPAPLWAAAGCSSGSWLLTYQTSMSVRAACIIGGHSELVAPSDTIGTVRPKIIMVWDPRVLSQVNYGKSGGGFQVGQGT